MQSSEQPIQTRSAPLRVPAMESLRLVMEAVERAFRPLTEVGARLARLVPDWLKRQALPAVRLPALPHVETAASVAWLSSLHRPTPPCPELLAAFDRLEGLGRMASSLNWVPRKAQAVALALWQGLLAIGSYAGKCFVGVANFFARPERYDRPKFFSAEFVHELRADVRANLGAVLHAYRMAVAVRFHSRGSDVPSAA